MNPPLTPDLLAHLEDVADTVARECARLVRDERPSDLGVAATKSSASDVVTAMDTASEGLARRLLAEHRPDDGFHGEEGGSASGTSGLTWVVDPIDGTVNYLYGHPSYAVSVAACVGDPATAHGFTPVAAAVAAPVQRECFRAHAGGGARLVTLDDALAPATSRDLHVEAPCALGDTLLGTGFGYRADVRAWQGRIVADLLPQVRDIRRGGSAAIDLCWVAAGRLDAYAEHGLNPWDLAGGWLVVAEAGGTVCDLAGDGPTREWTIAGGADAVAALREALRAAGGHDVPQQA